MASIVDAAAPNGKHDVQAVRPRRRLLKRIALGMATLLLLFVGVVGFAALRVRSTVLSTNPAPESETGLRSVAEVRTAHSMVVAAHPEAVRIGSEVLAQGGSAVDAAVAVQAALTLTEPQSSGIGGGAFVLYYDARSGVTKAYDGRETAPAAATPSLWLDEKGKPMSFPAALVGGRSVGVPGVVRLLGLLHQRHGHLPWSQLFDGAARLAENGFTVTPRLHSLLEIDAILPAMSKTRGYFFGDDGWALPPGTTLRNAPLAATFRTLARDGAEAFYSGALAQDMVAAVHDARRPSMARLGYNLVARQLGIAAMGSAGTSASGGLSLADLLAYRVKEREPVCGNYRRFRVCGFPPPSAGGIAVLQVLALLERFELHKLKPSSVEFLHLLTEAERLAYADRERYIADPDFVSVPEKGLVDAQYLRERGARINPQHSLGNAVAGQPPGAPSAMIDGQSFDVPSTTHFVIADAAGNVVSMTSSVEFAFGSHLLVNGFLLNNQLTDFSFTPQKNGQPIANAVAPSKRPRSAMSPLIVFDAATGKPVLALGSPGGGRIIGYVLRALLGMLDFELSPQQAVSLPHVVNMNGATEIEDVGWSSPAERKALMRDLSALGHSVSVGQQNSGLHVVKLGPDGLLAGIDPRREGAAAGQ